MSQFFRLYLIFNLLGLPLIIDSVMRFILVWLRFRVIPPVSLAPLASLGGETGSRRGLVVLIAARDEAGTIGATVESMRPLLQEVPGSRLWVVADHCADGTASEAGAAGALFVDHSRQYLRDLLRVPLYLLVWGQSLILSLPHRGRAVWLRAGRS